MAGRRSLRRLVPVPLALDQPAVEPADEMRRKDSSGANLSTNNSSHSVLAACTVVPAGPSDVIMPTGHSADTGHRDAVASHTLPLNSNQINTLRLDALRSSSLSKGLSQESMAIISHPRLVDSSTNRSYRRGQALFVVWALENEITINDFSVNDLTNFLSHLHHTRGYQVGTLKLVRAVVTHLHHSPATIRQQSDNPVVSLLDSLASQAPPRPQYKPAVDLSKTLKFLAEIPSSTTTALSPLQGKVAFLMGMAAFLRPSDLQRIDLLSCVVDSSGILSFNVVAPKERCKKQRIIKQLTIHPHANNASICPVAAFLALRDRHRLQRVRPPSALFVQSGLPSQPVLSTTIASWIRRLIRISTSERNVSLRSVAASLALTNGLPLQDIITLGNWTSSTTFENHYKRHSAMRTDFTTAVLSDIPISTDSDTEDNFEDALSDFRS